MIRLANRLGATLTLPVTISWRRVPLSIEVPTLVNAGGHGSVVVGRSRIEARQFTLSGSIYYPNRQAVREAVDNLLQFLQHPPIEVFKWPDDERRLYAWPQGAPQDWMDAGAELVIDIPMIAPDPYWYGTEVSVSAGSTINVSGNAPTPPLVTIQFNASGSGVRLMHNGTGRAIQLAGSFSSGSVLVINTARCHATLNGEPVNDRLSDEFIAYGFELVPGANALTYTGPSASVTVTYRPRWY